MFALRPLPPRPSLEFERKEAKALLRRLRAGDPDALARARERHPTIDGSPPERIRLADAQLVIAREYGFASWPRLVQYFGDVDRLRRSQRSAQGNGRNFYDGSVRSLIVEHRDRRAWVGRVLASYVPQFYGMRLNDIFDSPITEDDARLAIARTYGAPSWEVLLDRDEAERRRRPGDWEVDPMRYASKAIQAADLQELQRIVEMHPHLARPVDVEPVRGYTLLSVALEHEPSVGRTAMRPIIDWLETQGLDLQRELNFRLCGHMRMKTDTVRSLLDRGADPNWIAPNGISVLEHALIRYWNGEAVDLVAAHVRPRRALWIAAGLGDVDGVRRFLDANGKPTPAARRLRPDFDAVASGYMPSPPDPDDEELLMEAFFIAMVNGRAAVLEYMVSRGFPVDSVVWGKPIIQIAVGNGMTPMVECLVRCGSNLDIPGWRPQQSARQIAREIFEHMSQDADRRRIVELCGMDPDAVLAERDARPVKPPAVAPKLQEALELAGDDAFRLGQKEIRPENLLFGLLRGGGLLLNFFANPGRVDLDRLREDVKARMLAADDRVDRPKLPFDSDAQAMLQSAIALATERRRDSVITLHLLYALIQDEHGAAADLLTRYGSSAAALNAELERTM